MVSVQRVLDVELPKNDSGATTICGFLSRLLEQVWTLDEEFSGKRPFGSSGWRFVVYRALIEQKLIAGTFDEYGGIEEFDMAAADQLILSAIKALGDDW